ncbi:deoxynucleotidyltransferase terminal-interacting protein 2 [Thunnus maccoyii]|uniref:deoxynucleotidyltransferase terminal-interacting protein 2 n=1 Tax=Thunnus maccoyii TaxID=8240 RepID=UPI001C4CE178|nr:deoxynucleotidyltransferase terminal-interacting protein 2 [Thunnus maccoyii]
MVATRRGVRVYSPTKTNPDQPSEVEATPSTGRRTRRAAKQEETPIQQALGKTSSPPASPPTSLRRCTRASRLHSPEQPCTPVGSVHEADTSDLESCCSAVSDIEPQVTRTRGRRRQAPTGSQEDEVSEVESCSSAVSASKASQSSRRSTRRKVVLEKSDPADVEAGDVKVDAVLETESCSSVVSESQRVTRSQRKTARTRSSARRQIEDSEVSEAESCTSSVSGTSRSTTRSATRSRRQTHPIPIDLDEASEGSRSPAPTGRRSRAARGKTAVDFSEPRSCDSEGFESGPTYSMTTRRRGKTQSVGPKVLDSDSELTDMQSPLGSPCSSRGRGSPCSSRTGSGNSSRGAPSSRRSVKDLSIVLEKTGEPAEEDSLLNDSRLESTLIAEDADCTLLEEDKSQILEEKEGVKSTDLASNEASANVKRGVNVISEEDSHVYPPVSDGPGCAKEAEVVCEAAVTPRDQQEEPRAENKDGDTSEVEMMQETVLSSEPLKPSVTVTICEKASEDTEETKEEEEAMEVADVDTHPSQGVEHIGGDTVVETQSSEEEKMEVSTMNRDAQQVVDSSEVQVEAIQVTSKQEHKITVDSDSEQQPKDVTVQKTKIVSLLVSSEDEDEDDYAEEEEEREVSGEEEDEEEDLAEERGRPSKKSEAADESVEGLFMIDTRPGQAADEDYYKEGLREEAAVAAGRRKEGAEQEEQDEEFVDEEEEDDDDEDADILFSSRDPHSKELSSRIDPGIRMKELGGLYINFDGSKSKPVSSSLQKLKEKKIQDEVMKKSMIGPDFEKKDAVPPYSESKQALKLKRRAEREKTTGDGWFNMKAPEITGELKGDLQVLKMRGSLDPKRFYKKNDRDGFPKYFQVGTVVDSAVDFYHSRVPKKERKRTMVEELLADAEFRHKNKKKYQHIVTEKAALGAGKRKKKKKFHKK